TSSLTTSSPRSPACEMRVSSPATTSCEAPAARRCSSATRRATSSSCSSPRRERVPLDLVRRFRRGAVSVHVLHHAAKGDVHGAWLTEELARHGHRLSPGTLYPLLHRLEDEGLLVGRNEVIDGRVLRRYRATPTGRKALADLRHVVAELADEVAASDRR